MESKTKLIVFHKKEVGLIFLFMLFSSITSFVLGVKMGKKVTLESMHVKPEDERRVIDLLSKNEEQVKALHVTEAHAPVLEKTGPEEEKPNESEQRLKEKMNSEFGTKLTEKAPYTILLGSYRSMNEASEFASGFKARGYTPLVRQVELPHKGTFFRVSLGSFTSAKEAQEYTEKEHSLFVGQDYSVVDMTHEK